MHAGTKLIASSNADWVANKNVQSLTAVVVVVEVKTTPRRRPQNVMGQKHRTITYLHYICKLLCESFSSFCSSKTRSGVGGEGSSAGPSTQVAQAPHSSSAEGLVLCCVCVSCVCIVVCCDARVPAP